jgi:hypothetical protein
VLQRLAAHERRAQIVRAIDHDVPRTAAVLRGDLDRAGLLQRALDAGVDALGEARVRERGECRARILRRQRLDRGEALRERIGERIGVARHEDRGGVHAGAPAVLGDRVDQDVQVLRPGIDRVLADHDLRSTGAVDLHARIARVGLRHRDVAEEQRAPAELEDRGGALVIRRVEGERLRRHPRGDQRLHDAQRRPGLLAAGLQHDRDAERERGDPDRVHAGRVRGQHDAERARRREEAERHAVLHAAAAVEHGEIHRARESAQDHVHAVEDGVHLGHVRAHHGVREARGARERLHVLVGPLLAARPHGQAPLQEQLARALADAQALGDRDRAQRGEVLVLLLQVAAHDACVGLIDDGEDRAAAEVLHLVLLEALVGLPGA